jgi:hypothetical protein
MANKPVPRCPRPTGNSQWPETETKANIEEYISPDILLIFREDKAEAPAGPLAQSTEASGPARPEKQEELSRFPQFQRLPPEIRYLIWEAAVPEPTAVPRTWNNAKFRYNLQRGVPAVLQACAESRALLLAQSPAAASGVGPKYQLVRTPGREDEGAYMDFDRDAVWVYRGCEFCCFCLLAGCCLCPFASPDC